MYKQMYYRPSRFTNVSWCRWMVPSGRKMFFQIITQLAHFHKSQIHLVQVVQTPEMARQMPPRSEDIELSNRVVARNREEAGHYLEQMKARSILEGIAVQVHLLTSNNAAVALHQLAEQEHIDMVALSAHGYSGNQQWPYGSMVNNFILYSKAPLLIVQDLPGKQDATAPVQTSRNARSISICRSHRRSFHSNQPVQITETRLREFALELATRVTREEPARHPNNDLLEQLQDWEQALRNANAIFKTTASKDLPVTRAGEWMLDNFYIIKQTFRQIGEGLPASYLNQLPKLGGMP